MNANVGKLLFGINASDTAQGWYILGKDNGVQGDNTIIFAASPIATGKFNNEQKNKSVHERLMERIQTVILQRNVLPTIMERAI